MLNRIPVLFLASIFMLACGPVRRGDLPEPPSHASARPAPAPKARPAPRKLGKRSKALPKTRKQTPAPRPPTAKRPPRAPASPPVAAPCRDTSRALIVVSTHGARRKAEVYQSLAVYARGAWVRRDGKKVTRGCMRLATARQLRLKLGKADFRHVDPRPTCRALQRVTRTVDNRVQQKLVGTGWPCGLPMRKSVTRVMLQVFKLTRSRLITVAEAFKMYDKARPDATKGVFGRKCSPGGPVIYSHRVSDLRARKRIPPGVLKIHRNGAWRYRSARASRVGCLTLADLRSVRLAITTAKLKPFARLTCAALPTDRHELTMRQGTAIWKAPCGPRPPLLLGRLIHEVRRTTGVLPKAR